MFPGAFKRTEDDSRYSSDKIEAMYQGYKMAADHKEAMHERCNPDRYVSIGMWTQTLGLTNGQDNHRLTSLLNGLPEEEYQRLFKAILTVANGSP